jgi:AAA domain
VTGASDIPADLMFVDDTDSVGSLNFLLYGPPGSGKSVASCSAPGPVLAVNADRRGALRFARRLFGPGRIREVRFEGRRTIAEVKEYLASEAGAEIGTVSVDPLGEVYAKLAREIGGKKPSLEKWGVIVGEVRDFIDYLLELDKHVVIVCHEQIDDSEEGGATRRPLAGGNKLPEYVAGAVDVVGYCAAVEQQKGPPVYMAQLVQAKGRRAKDSTGVLGVTRKLDLGEWIATICDAYLGDLPFDATEPEADAEAAVQADDAVEALDHPHTEGGDEHDEQGKQATLEGQAA